MVSNKSFAEDIPDVKNDFNLEYFSKSKGEVDFNNNDLDSSVNS